MRAKTIAIVVCLVLALGGGLFAFAARHPAIAPIALPAPASFEPALVKRGAALAAVGDCAGCHTAPGGRDLAGGVAIPTPFGAIYSSNITPDAETGIGAWSEAAFQRAMSRGVRRDGALLYPAFPYDHFMLVSNDDDRALYAFLMTRPPVHAVAPGNDLRFPFNHRFVVAGWNLLFLRSGPPAAYATHDASFVRGEYLVEGLAHCGACHTPRNAFGAEKASESFAGATIDGWTAYALNGASPAAVPWTAEALYQYLRNGFEPEHGTARGPMAEVIADLSGATDNDIRAIASYVAGQMGKAAERKSALQQGESQAERGRWVAATSADSQAVHRSIGGVVSNHNDEGAAIYATACAGCHEGPRAMPFGGINLALSSAVRGVSAHNLLNIILHGVPAAAASRSPIMPGFANALDDNQLGALVRYLRAGFTDEEAWTGIEAAVHAARGAEREVTIGYAARQAGE